MLSSASLTSLKDDNLSLAIAVAALVATTAWLLVPRSPSPFLKDGKPVKLRTVPRPAKTLPVVGNLFEVAANQHRYHSWLLDTFKQIDFQPWQLKIPGQARLFVFAAPEPFDEILARQFDNFSKGEYQLEMVTTFFGKSVVGSDGERWYHQRKTATRFFSARSLRAYMASSARRNLIHVMDIIDAKRLKGEEANLTQLFHDFTMQTFVETGLGVDLDWIGRAEPHPFSLAVDEASHLMAQRFAMPTWLWKLQRSLNIGGEAKLAKHMDLIVSWLSDVVDKSLKAGVAKHDTQDGEEEIKSMVQLFAEQSREDAEGLRSEDLVDFIQVMIIAARDTTAIALTWLFFELSKNPHVEAKIRDELKLVYPDRVGKSTNYFTPEETKSLVYLEASLKEALRLHPPAAFMFKETAEDTVVCEDIFLRKGELVGLSVYCAARNPHVWGEDAAEFNPSRWIDDNTGELKQFSSAKFASFSAGPRSCVGMSLAMLELRVVAANLLSRFRFQLDESLDDSYASAALLVMKSPILAQVSLAHPASGAA